MATENDDILLDETGDDVIKNGDLVIDDGTIDDCLIIIRLNKGEVKAFPTLGPNIITMMNAAQATTQMKQQLLINLEMDGKQPKKLEIKDGNIDFEI